MKKSIIVIIQNEIETRVSLLDSKCKLIESRALNINTQAEENNIFSIDPLEIIYNIRSLINGVMQNQKKISITAIGITTSSQQLVIWDQFTGMPLTKTICTEKTELKDAYIALKKKRIPKHLNEIGAPELESNSALTHLNHISKNDSNLLAKRNHKNLAIGTFDTWILYHLTNFQDYKINVSAAQTTGLYNVWKQKWDSYTLKEIGLNSKLLPEICPNITHFGSTQNFLPLPDGIPILSSSNLTASLLAASRKNGVGDALLKLNFCAELWVNTGQTTTPLSQYTPFPAPSDVNIVSFMMQKISLPENISTWINKLPKAKTPLNISTEKEDLFVVPIPAKNGIFHHSNPKVAVIGIDQDTTQEMVLNAFLHSIAYISSDNIQDFEKNTHLNIRELAVIGHYCKYPHLLQQISNLIQHSLIVFNEQELLEFGTFKLMRKHPAFKLSSISTLKPPKALTHITPTIDPISSFAKLNRFRNLQLFLSE